MPRLPTTSEHDIAITERGCAWHILFYVFSYFELLVTSVSKEKTICQSKERRNSIKMGAFVALKMLIFSKIVATLRETFIILLVLRLVGFLSPHAEHGEGFVAQQGNDGGGAVGHRLLQFAVDKVVIEVNIGSILAVVGIVDAVETGPVDGSETHGARLAGGVNFVATEIESAQFATSFTDACHFGMGRGVVKNSNAVGSTCHDFSVLGDDGSEGASAALDAFCREAYGLAHHLFVLFCDIHTIIIMCRLVLTVCKDTKKNGSKKRFSISSHSILKPSGFCCVKETENNKKSG